MVCQVNPDRLGDQMFVYFCPKNFFRKGNLTALREMSLRMTAERVDQQLREYRQTRRITGTWKAGTRFIVGVDADEDAISVIRWARQMSYAMDASWVAVYVETSARLSAQETDQLQKNLKIAQELGAEVLTTSDEDVAGALLRTAHEQNASQILVGKPKKRKFFRSSDLFDRLLQRNREVDIYIVGYEGEQQTTPARIWLPRIQSEPSQYFLAVAIILSVALVCFPFSSIIGYRTVSLIILLTVSLLPLQLEGKQGNSQEKDQ